MSHLTYGQRYEIAALRFKGFSLSAIGTAINKNKSVISRELFRNSDKRNNVYRADLAQVKTDKRHKVKSKKISFSKVIEERVTQYLKDDFSPEQVVGFFRENHIKCVSAERIYQFVWSDKKQGGLLYKHLRTKGKRYAKRGNLKGSRGIIKDRIDIDERPKIVENKERFGERFSYWKKS